MSFINVATRSAEAFTGSNDVVRRRAQPLDLMATEDERLDFAYRYWTGKRQNGLLPARKDIDVIDLRPVIGAMHIVDVAAADPNEYRFRVYGSKVRMRRFQNYTNHCVGDHPSETYRSAVAEDYLSVVATGVPSYQQIVARIDHINYSYSRLLLPLADDGRRVNMLLVCINDRAFDDFQV